MEAALAALRKHAFTQLQIVASKWRGVLWQHSHLCRQQPK